MNTEKFKGVFPAFYACYDDNGEISAERTLPNPQVPSLLALFYL